MTVFSFVKNNSQNFSILFQIKERMIVKEYIGRLKDLQEDRSNYERFKDKTNFKSKMTKQEYKYQAYIIDQMNQKNKLIAASQLQDILIRSIKREQSFFMKVLEFEDSLIKNKTNIFGSSTASLSPSQGNISAGQESVTVNFILVKLCSDVIKRQLQKIVRENIKNGFDSINIQFLRIKKLTKMTNIIQKYHQKVAMKALQLVQTKSKHRIFTEGKIFDQSFSMIARNQRNKKQRSVHHMEESYLSLILDKQNFNYQCPVCKDTGSGTHHQHEEISKLKEDLAFMRTLLTQKTLELKKRTDQCVKIRQYYEEKFKGDDASRVDEYSQIQSRNSSYLSEMERQVFGGKRIRKNGSRSSESSQNQSQLNRSQISKQLLGKYMKQSFQLRQNMDIARQMCLDLQQKLQGTVKRQIHQIIKVLNANDQPDLSLVDQS